MSLHYGTLTYISHSPTHRIYHSQDMIMINRTIKHFRLRPYIECILPAATEVLVKCVEYHCVLT